VLWNEASNNPKTTTGVIEFRNGTDIVFVFSTPFAVDANGEQVSGRMVMRKSGANLFTDVQIPYAWMQTATYPIKIDPTIDTQIAANGDDRTYVTDPNLFQNETQIGYNSGGPRYCSPFTRFDGMTVSGTIDVAYITLTVLYSISPNWSTIIAAYDGADPAAPTTTGGFTGFTRTTNTVTWTVNTGSWAGNTEHNTPSIVSMIQELVDSYSYSSTAMIIVFDENGGTSTNSTYFYDYNDNTAKAAKLHIEYTSSVIEQEGYRFRADDGSESAATWLEAQDTNITRAIASPARLRVLINATGDPASAQYQLEVRRSGGTWRKI